MERPSGSAIRYDGPGVKPRPMTATRGAVADAIAALTCEHRIPLHEDAALVEALARLETVLPIPREILAIVADVLAVIYAADRDAAPHG